jgi:hypothetical protein
LLTRAAQKAHSSKRDGSSISDQTRSARLFDCRLFAHLFNCNFFNDFLFCVLRVGFAGQELDSMRRLFGEKQKELAVALAKVDALSRQLDELRQGDTSNSYEVGPTPLPNAFHAEIDKLRHELLVSFRFRPFQTTFSTLRPLTGSTTIMELY